MGIEAGILAGIGEAVGAAAAEAAVAVEGLTVAEGASAALTAGEMAEIGAVVGATGVSVSQNRRIAGEQGEVADQQAATQKAQVIQRRRRDFRKRRIAAARIRQSGEVTGTAGSSGETGALGGLATGAASFRAGERTTANANRQITRSSETIQSARTTNSLFQSAIRTGSTIFDVMADTDTSDNFVPNI